MIVWREQFRIDSSHGFLPADTRGVSGANRVVRSVHSEAYEQHVVRLLNRIASCRVGTIVLNRVAAIGRPIRIVPRVDLRHRVAQTPAALGFGNQTDRIARGIRGREGENGEVDSGRDGTGRAPTWASSSFRREHVSPPHRLLCIPRTAHSCTRLCT